MDSLIFLEKYAIYILGLVGLLYLYLLIRAKVWTSQGKEDLEESFINSKEKFLVFKPQVGLKNLDSSYGYFHLKGSDEWNFDRKDMDRRFEVIRGLCKECHKNPAMVGYYEEGYMKGFPDHNQWVIPQDPPTPLCKKCAFRKIQSSLRIFNGGMGKPYGGDGIYISTTTEEK